MKLARETRLPGTETCSRGRGRQRVSPPPGPGRPRPLPRAPVTRHQVPRAVPSDPPRTPRRPPPGTRQAANHTRRTAQSRFQRGRHGRPHTRARSLPPAGAEAAAAAPSTSRGSGNGGVRLPGAKSVPAREETRETPPRAGHWRWERRKRSYLRTVLSADAVEAGGAGRPGGRAGPGAAAATAVPSAPLFPFQEDPGEAEPGNQEVPQSDTSCRCYGNGPPPPRRLARDPASAPPAPPASRATAKRRRCGPGRRHLGAARAPVPSGTCAPLPRSRRPRGRASGLRGAGAVSRILRKERRPDPRTQSGGGRGWGRLETLEALRENDRPKLASGGRVKRWLGPGVRAAERWPRAWFLRPGCLVFHLWLNVPAVRLLTGSLIFSAPQFLHP